MNAKANDGTTPLHLACQRGNEQAVELLLASEEIDETITDENGDTPLHEACSSGETEIVEKILTKLKSRPGQVNLLLPNDKELTPLHIACREGYVDIVKLLLKEGFHQKKDLVEAQDNERSTPLHLACENGREGNEVIIQTLLLYNADIFSEMGGGLTPMHIAAKYGHKSVMEMLYSSGEKIFEVQDDNDQTPLHYAAENNQVEMIEYLIDKYVYLHEMYCTKRILFTRANCVYMNLIQAEFEGVLGKFCNFLKCLGGPSLNVSC